MKRLIFLLLMLSLLWVPAPARAQDPPQQVLDRIDQAMQHLSDYLGRTITRRSHFWSWAERVYNDVGMECPAAGATYSPETTRGYRVRITVDDIEYDYRIKTDGSVLVLCGPNGFALYRSDGPSIGGATSGTFQIPTAAWYAWIYMDGNDLMYLVNPSGLQATMKRPQLTNEASGNTPLIAISPNMAYMLIAKATTTGTQAVGIYSFASGTFTATLTALPGESVNLGWGQGSFGIAGSPLIFDSTNTRAAIGLRNETTGEWRVLIVDLASGAVTHQLRHLDLPGALQNPDTNLTNAVSNLTGFFPRIVYFDNSGGLHVQLILANAGGADTYPAFVWYPDTTGIATTSPYTHSSHDILLPFGTMVYTYQNAAFPSLPPNGPFVSHNAVAQAIPAGPSVTVSPILTNSNYFHFGAQWADSGQKVIFQVDDGVSGNRWAIFSLSAPPGSIADLLPTTFRQAHGNREGALMFDENFVLYLVQSSASLNQIWTAPPRVGNPNFVWVQPANVNIGISSIDLSTWGQGSTSGPAAPPSGVQYCAGTIPSRLQTGVRARVTFTDGTPLRLREAPGGTFLRDMAEGTEFAIIGGPQCHGGYTWWNIRLDNGQSGWSAEGDNDTYFMEPATTTSGTSSGGGTTTSGPNPATGTFQTTFQAGELSNLAFGVTLGGQAVCKYHNITLQPTDVGKTLNVALTNWDVTYPNYYTSLPLWVSLYRSYVGSWTGQQNIDLFQSPVGEQVIRNTDWISFTWLVSQAGNYVICLETEANTYYDSNVSFNWANYSVLLTGG